MIAWRLARKSHGPALDGAGGRHTAGRWNSKGSPVCYCTSSPALAILERRVHVPRYADLPADLVLYKLNIPDGLPQREILAELPKDWIHNPALTQAIGDGTCRRRDIAVLIVPSAIIELDRNVLLVGTHPAIMKIEVLDKFKVRFDQRLFD